MKRMVVGMTAAFTLLITIFFAASAYYLIRNYSEAADAERAGNLAVAMNEIDRLAERIRNDPYDAHAIQRLGAAVSELEVYDAASASVSDLTRLLIIACAACVLFAAAVFAVCYVRIIRPFDKLEDFAREVAKGNLDTPLAVKRMNIFGEFTWAFDLMRSELKGARENEESTRRENKALIATISHDIKTPVASIRAYAEGLQRGMDTTPERRERYLGMIVRKSDEVAKLTNDLFLHALSDMEKLQLEVKPHDAKTLIGEVLDASHAEYGDTIIAADIPDATVMADEKRLAQVLANIINNAVKYAPCSKIDISFHVEDDLFYCKVRDFGSGIPPRDLPFVWNRFYRGANTEGVPGSGLGLYIVKYIVEKCGGTVRLENSDSGLAVTFALQLSNPE